MPYTLPVEALRRYMVCIAAFAVSLVAFPLLALAPMALPFRWPSWLGNLLFFWPQYLLLPGGLRTPPDGAVARLEVLAPALAVCFWLLAIAGYVYATRGWTKRRALAAFGPAVLTTAWLVAVALAAMGYAPVLDGL